MTEEAFREIMTEILESKVELLQALEDWGKKFDNLINARAYFQSEQPKGMTVPQDYDPLQTPKKESKIKTKVKEEITEKPISGVSFNENVKGIPYSFKEDGKVKSYILINEVEKEYAFAPGWVINARKLPRVEIIAAALKKGYDLPKWKPFTERFWEEKS